MLPAETPNLELPHILIVEDCPEQRNLLRHTLTKNGYLVQEAFNGSLAWDMVQNHPPRLVITDVSLPQLDGFQLCRKIKTEERFRHIPVVLLTAMWEVENLLRGMESGANHYMIKPWDKAALLARVTELFEGNGNSQPPNDIPEDLVFFFGGKRHTISLNRRQILNFLLPTYEMAIEQTRKNLTGLRGRNPFPKTP